MLPRRKKQAEKPSQGVVKSPEFLSDEELNALAGEKVLFDSDQIKQAVAVEHKGIAVVSYETTSRQRRLDNRTMKEIHSKVRRRKRHGRQ